MGELRMLSIRVVQQQQDNDMYPCCNLCVYTLLLVLTSLMLVLLSFLSTHSLSLSLSHTHTHILLLQLLWRKGTH